MISKTQLSGTVRLQKFRVIFIGSVSLFFLLIFLFSSVYCSETVLERIQKLPFRPADQQSEIQGFQIFGGQWSLDKGVLTGKSGAGWRIVPVSVKEISCGEMEAEMLIHENQNGFSGLGFKISDSGIGADNYNGYEIGFNPRAKIIMAGAHRHNFKPLKTVPFDIPVKSWFKIKIRFTETSFDVFLNNGEKAILSVQEENMPSRDVLRRGSVAFRIWNYDASFRNLKVRDFGDAETALNESKRDVVPWQSVSFIKKKSQTLPWPDSLDLSDLPPILVLLRSPLKKPNSVGNDIWQGAPVFPGCEIRLIDPANPKKPVQTIFSDPEGSIYDMDLSYDAKTIFFSYRPKRSSYWHIYKIGVDGRDLKQLTDGDYYDISPCEVPDGRIVFVSTRRYGHTVCQPGPASNLFRMNADGNGITCISMNTLSDMTPRILPDGRILFTRWEYVDRDLTYRQSLWTENPDGSLYQLFFGNTIRDTGSFMQARALPESGSRRVVATFAPHHGYPHGAIGIIDRTFGVEGEKGKSFIYITKEFPRIGDSSQTWGYRDPFPLTDDLFLCSFGGTEPTVFSSPDGAKPDPRFRIWLLDITGEKRMIYEDPKFSCVYPIPLLEREKPVQSPPRITDPDLKKDLRPTLTKDQVLKPRHPSWNIPEYGDPLQGDPVGTVLLTDVYNGLDERVIKRGSVKSIRIMEQIRKTEDLVNRAYDQSPVMSYGTYYAKRNWGTVPVEEDGSANFYVPALREIYFQILDDQGRELYRMTSAAQFMQGENVSCLGCHEPRDTLPGTATKTSHRAMASSRKPSTPVLPEWMIQLPKERTNRCLDAGIVDYPSVVQPVLDKYCVECHQGTDPDGGYDLSGGKTRFFNMSYDNLLGKSRSYRQHEMLTGEMLKDQLKLGKPLVHFYWLLFTPSAVHQPNWSGTFASRLPDYFKKDHCKKTVAQEDLERIYLWIDSDVPYYGTYKNARPYESGRRDAWSGETAREGKTANWFRSGILPVYERSCQSCHKNIFGGNRDLPGVHDTANIDWIGRFAWLNLTQPENSPFLNAHLSKKQGGRGISADPNDPKKMIFSSRNDPNYLAVLKAIQNGAEIMRRVPEADQAGFRAASPEP